MNKPHEALEAACDLRFGQVGMACVRVRRADAVAVFKNLEQRVRTAPQMFLRTAVVLDLSHLRESPDDDTVRSLLEAIRSAGMLPVGLAYGTRDTEALAARLQLPLIAKFRDAFERSETLPDADAPPAARAEPEPEPAPDPEPVPATPRTQVHDGHVRSGQQIYARKRDLVVQGTVANAAEIIADGSIHVYGSLRGRALAGAQGDRDARIWCSHFRAELVSIAGQYRVIENLPDEIAGKPVVCRLDGDKLLIESL